MRTKITADAKVKAIGDEDEGRFQAYASVFDVIDSYGDMVVAGAFEESLATYGKEGSGIPIYWRHRTDDPFMNLGATTKAVEDEHGLWIEGQLDLTTQNAKQTYKLLREGRVKQMSFMYDTLEGAWVERKPEEGGSYYELRKLHIHEVSVVPVGANQDTEILLVKSGLDSISRDIKAGREPSAAERQELIGAVKVLLDSLTPEHQEEEDAAPDAKAEEPAGAKAEEQPAAPSPQHLGLITIATAQ